MNNGVIITGFNRPEYLKECIRSVESNPESQTLTFIFALDGGLRSKQHENIKIIEESNIKNKIILKRESNYGCAKNHIDSKRYAFDVCKFDKVIVLEEDVMVTPQYFSLILNLHEWSKSKYDNIGAVQAWSPCLLPVSEKIIKLSEVSENKEPWSFVSYCIDIESWNKIKNVLYAYESFVDEIIKIDPTEKIRSKPNTWSDPSIKNWALELLMNKKNQIFTENSLKPAVDLSDYYRSERFETNQDHVMGFSLFFNDLIKLNATVNRIIHIGKIGITTDENEYFRYSYNLMALECFKEDQVLKEFKLI